MHEVTIMAKSIEELRIEWAGYDAIRDAGVIDPENIIRHTDISYSTYPETLLDVYYPEGTSRPLPTIISIHGGGWFTGSKQLYSHYCLRLADRGFTVVNFNYRLAPEYKYPAPLEDCCALLHWIKENAAAYYIDLNNVFVVGDSAGGQIALQLLTMMTSDAYNDLFPFSPPKGFKVNACGLNYGCYFMPVSKMVPPEKAGDMFVAYFPEDYLPCVPSLQAHKYVNWTFPPAFVMTSRNDYLRMMAPPLHAILKFKGAESVLRFYGKKSEKEIGHVFHLNCHTEIAKQCNDDQCAFFRAHMV